MNKRQERQNDDNEKTKRLVRRNWIIMAVSLAAAFFCYFFLDGIISSFRG